VACFLQLRPILNAALIPMTARIGGDYGSTEEAITSTKRKVDNAPYGPQVLQVCAEKTAETDRGEEQRHANVWPRLSSNVEQRAPGKSERKKAVKHRAAGRSRR